MTRHSIIGDREAIKVIPQPPWHVWGCGHFSKIRGGGNDTLTKWVLPEWKAIDYRLVILAPDAATSLLYLSTIETKVTNYRPQPNSMCQTMAILDPLSLMAPILRDTFMSPPAEYALIKVRGMTLQL